MGKLCNDQLHQRQHTILKSKSKPTSTLLMGFQKPNMTIYTVCKAVMHDSSNGADRSVNAGGDSTQTNTQTFLIL